MVDKVKKFRTGSKSLLESEITMKKPKAVKKTVTGVSQKQSVNVKININDKKPVARRRAKTALPVGSQIKDGGVFPRITSFPVFENVPYIPPTFNEKPLTDIRQEIKEDIKQEIKQEKEKEKTKRKYNKTGKYSKAKQVDNFTSMENAEKVNSDFTTPIPSKVDYFDKIQTKNDLYNVYQNQSDVEFFNPQNKGERLSFTSPKNTLEIPPQRKRGGQVGERGTYKPRTKPNKPRISKLKRVIKSKDDKSFEADSIDGGFL